MGEDPFGEDGPARIATCDEKRVEELTELTPYAEEVALEQLEEKVDIICERYDLSRLRTLVKARTTTQTIELRKPPFEFPGSAVVAWLPQGGSTAIGSPVTAGENSPPILVQILDEDGEISGSFVLDAAESVDVSFTDLGTAEMNLLVGTEVVVSSGEQTITLTDTDQEATVVVESAVDILTRISQKITEFVSSGDIATQGIANSLNASLNNATKLVDLNNNAVKGILGALVNKLEAFVNGNKVSSSVRDVFVPSVEALIFSLEL